MRILILGQNYAALRFCELFEKDNNNIVFSDFKENKNYIEFQDSNDILEFCEENIINLVLIIDEKYINSGLQELISSKNISAFSPSIETVSICSSKSQAKRFMHKNKILTPKFQVAEKPQQALDYIRQADLPLTIKPDNHSFVECSKFAETFSQAQKTVNNLFSSGNKKIVIEDYVYGKNFTIWVLSDGYSAKILATCAKYQNDVAYFEPRFISEELKETLFDSVIMRTINALASLGEEYIGILGFDFILDKENNAWLVGYNSFFDEISVDFFVEGFDLNWADVFDSTIVGDVFLKYNFENNGEIMLTLKDENDKIKFISAKTTANLYRYLENLDIDTKEFEEAQKIWKS